MNKGYPSKPNCECYICGKPIYKIPSRKSDHPLCSYACRNKYFSGHRSFAWKGGPEEIQKRKRSYQGREAERARREHRKRKAAALLGGKCSCCGYDRCIDALEFHHVAPCAKEKTIKELRMASWARIETEVKKCVLLCANCHREVHGRLRRNERSTTKSIVCKIRRELQRPH